MVDKAQVRQSLETLIVPNVKRSVLEMNLLRDTAIDGDKVKLSMAATALDSTTQDWVKSRAIEAIKALPGVNHVELEFVEARPQDINSITHVIAVMSGKGGVGKSLVASLAGVALKRLGNEVGILDADITGPSIPRMFGVRERPTGNETGILPVNTRSGIEVMSINLLLPTEQDAVIWRGPLIGKTITQFWEEVLWGRLDFLVVDLPPGTSDAPLTVLQTLPISGVIIVFTPQDLVEMIVRKAANMAQKMDKRVIGAVENMSYLYVPEIDKKIEIFGKSRGEEMAASINAPLLGKLPIDPELAKLCDQGNIERYDGEIVESLGKTLSQALEAATP